MVGGGRTGPASRRRARATSDVVPLSRPVAGDRLDLARLVPSGRSLVLCFGLLLGISLAYWGARASSLFDVQRVEVRGAPPGVVRQVERVTRTAVGTSLLEIDARQLEGAVRNLPSVAAASVDRSFPHTLVVRVAPVQPVAVARRGSRAWLVSASNRAIREIGPREHAGLGRLWIPKSVDIEPGEPLPTGFEPATRVLASVREARLPARVKAVRSARGELTVVLQSGVEILLGEPDDLVLKLAVAARVLPHVYGGTAYLDVSVPERPVAGSAYLKSQVEVEGRG
jgi:cell division protein FtsQ